MLRRTEEHKQVQLLAAAVTENLENIEKELAHLTSRTGGEEGKLQALKAQLQQQTARAGRAARAGDGADRQADRPDEQQQQLTDQITALRMDAASIETARAASENTIAQLQALSEAMQGDVTQKTGLIHEYELQISALEGQIQEKEDGLTASRHTA